ncbi:MULTISPECIES: Tn3 family transposase [unclassified Streptomyces]|uniref:Tn3 family transposase n=1 Tax=unclassified Streptomyces TaxID=2593676 RepID=UPI00336A415A
MTRPRHRSLTDATASVLPAQTEPVHPFAPDTSWEAVYIIEGLLKNTSEVKPATVHADTKGQSFPSSRSRTCWASTSCPGSGTGRT